MKAATGVLATLCICLVASILAVSDTSDPMIIVFYEEGCPSCEEMDELLVGMMADAPETALVRHEISDPKSMTLLTALARAYGIEVPSVVPIVFVAEDVVIGMGRTQEFSLRNAIGDCLSLGCESPIARLPASQLRADLPRLALLLTLFLALAWFQLH
jgi:thiol-disulfide isomerase/thioredoxin